MTRVSIAICVAISVLGSSACGGGTEDVPALVDAQVSPDGRLIAYAARDGDDLDLYVVNSSGGRPRRVASSDRSEQWPVWSPDSRRLAYLLADGYDYSGPGELWIVRASGGRKRQLSETASRDAEWSPDGRRLVFRSDDDDADDEEAGGRLYVVGADGRGLRRIASGRTGDSPRWSPDGKLVAFWSGHVDDFRDRGDLYVAVADSGRVRRLTRRGDVCRCTAEWAPDGSTILYRREVDDLLHEVIETVEVRTGDLHRIYGPELLWTGPFLSPNGRWIAIDDGLGMTVSSQDGSGRRFVDRRGMGSGHTWSPDSRRIAYDTYGGLYRPLPTDVIVASRDATKSRSVTHTPELSETFAGWLSDSRHVAVLREERSLWVFDLSGRGRRIVP